MKAIILIVIIKRQVPQKLLEIVVAKPKPLSPRTHPSLPLLLKPQGPKNKIQVADARKTATRRSKWKKKKALIRKGNSVFPSLPLLKWCKQHIIVCANLWIVKL